MLRSGAIQSLRALLALADAPGRWCSVAELARVQDLPAARLEQLLLRLRRAGVLEARRGRRGGYRLARPAAELSLAAIFSALESGLPGAALPWSLDGTALRTAPVGRDRPRPATAGPAPNAAAADRRPRSWSAGLQADPGVPKPLSAAPASSMPGSMASLPAARVSAAPGSALQLPAAPFFSGQFFSGQSSSGNPSAAPPCPAGVPQAEAGQAEAGQEDAGARVTGALNRRLQRALERELARTSLEDLHHDLQSARALLSDQGGLVLG